MVKPPGCEAGGDTPGGSPTGPDGETVGICDHCRMDLVTVRRDTLTGQWAVTCAVCGPLAKLRHYWPASYMAADHEAIHEEEEADPITYGCVGCPGSAITVGYSSRLLW